MAAVQAVHIHAEKSETEPDSFDIFWSVWHGAPFRALRLTQMQAESLRDTLAELLRSPSPSSHTPGSPAGSAAPPGSASTDRPPR